MVNESELGIMTGVYGIYNEYAVIRSSYDDMVDKMWEYLIGLMNEWDGKELLFSSTQYFGGVGITGIKWVFGGGGAFNFIYKDENGVEHPVLVHDIFDIMIAVMRDYSIKMKNEEVSYRDIYKVMSEYACSCGGSLEMIKEREIVRDDKNYKIKKVRGVCDEKGNKILYGMVETGDLIRLGDEEVGAMFMNEFAGY